MEVVGGSLLPAVERRLVVTHEVLARHDGVLLHPDEHLSEVETGVRECGRVVGDVAVAAPHIEAAAGLEHARKVAEPLPQQLGEGGVGHKVVRERAVAGAQGSGRLRLLGVAAKVEALVVAAPARGGERVV